MILGGVFDERDVTLIYHFLQTYFGMFLFNFEVDQMATEI